MFGEGNIKNNNCFYVKVVDHYENPKNVGTLDKQSRNVGTGLVGAPACGDVMKLQVSLAHLPIDYFKGGEKSFHHHQVLKNLYLHRFKWMTRGR